MVNAPWNSRQKSLAQRNEAEDLGPSPSAEIPELRERLSGLAERELGIERKAAPD